MQKGNRVTNSPPEEKVLDTRMARLLKKAKAENMSIPYEVFEYIVQHPEIDSQHLEPSLIRVMAYSSIVNRKINVELAKEALKEIGAREWPLPIAKRKRRSTHWFFSRGAFIAMLSGLILLNGCELGEMASLDAKKTEQTTKVKQAVIQQDIALIGQVEPYQEVAVAPAIDGNMKEILVDLGSYVKKDQVLAKLSESDLAYKAGLAEVQVKKAEVDARVKSIEQQISLNEMKVTLSTNPSTELEEQRFLIQNLEVELEDSKINWERINTLYSQGAVSKEEMEQARTRKTQADNDLNKAKKLVVLNELKEKNQKESAQSVAKLQQASDQATSQLTKMGVEEAKADLQIIRYQYSNLNVKAPISGFITDKKVMMGQAVSPVNSIFVITNLDKVYVKVDVPEALIPKMKLDQKASVTIPTLSKSLEGTIKYIAQVGNAEDKTFPVKVLIDNVNHEIKGGMTAQVSFNTEVLKNGK